MGWRLGRAREGRLLAILGLVTAQAVNISK